MGSLTVFTVLENSQVSPPYTTVGDRLLPLTYFDFLWLRQPPVHYLFFYQLSITQTQFIETIIPSLKHSLSITLQHFFPLAGNLIVYHTSTKKPEIRYVKGDSVAVTFAKCDLDFNELTGNHPRDCENFYHLIPQLGQAYKTSDFTKIPVFCVQVTLFPNSGISIGMTNHHCLGDASTRFCFLKAWTSIARFGSDESFLANGTLPIYDRPIQNAKLDESYLRFANVENFEDYQPPKLGGPTDKVRATYILPRPLLNRLKNLVSTELPTLAYVSSFTVACAYIWSCMAKMRNDGLQMFGFAIDCRARMNPTLPVTYFGNCIGGCIAMENSTQLTGQEGFVTAAKLIGEKLHKTLTDKDGIVKEIESFKDLFSNGFPTTTIWVAGTPKLKFYDMDFGWGKPKKIEIVSTDYNGAISVNACKEKNEDLEIGVSLSRTEMVSFVRIFEDSLEKYI
ncbi:putative anthocyanin 6''-O-malonyltransferase [Helianthus annuus]|uniref:Anthocyanin 6''-O-malonyltransferase n=1 Tax=Helianthus annuus TaxID=4232 RepID=A0A251RRE5_HELAN|nr:malonyl-coenzyme A:anthocyanin 3-O-glucoside-6''-O-malonyltransferase [Helianthus annuus]KAF5755932.1 putative anthocyanin 6''-O-malonyltransferase [Helianthus annuus]KAJ0429555.1 putative anthocyanin 6''-O-malonyltransferase [Helianthus annuus]KAJ0447942.1 putative anthocyanin 6''-O-malonyltransferase [Helianthus annuus]KAJ0632837.1 putative anthocyanin 6''-O-malonyltransferase [Helianthus annuus]KAJ0826794.1 putative anthocyanin 6''-O-malonyltransferase [Helianthus annuus]